MPTATQRASYHHGDLPNALRRAAVDVIAESGLGGFSLREVARRAGVSHTAPAHHFGDLTGLLTSLAVEGFDHLADEARDATVAVEPGDPAARLVALGQAYVRVGATYPSHCEVMFRDDLLHHDDPELVRAGLGAYGVLAEVVRELVAHDGLSVDVDEAARLCWSTMQGLLALHPKMTMIDERLGRTESASRDELVESFTLTIVAGLRARFGE